MNIVILDAYCENPGDLSWSAFEKFGNLTIYDRTDKKDIIDRIKDSEIVLTNKTPINKEAISVSKNLKYIGLLATGYNVVDVEEAKKNNIIVTNVPTYGTDAVGQFAIALLLEICHRIGHHVQTVKEGKWSKCKDWCYWDSPQIELAGKNMGIIGYGKIGKTTARIANAMGMNVLAFDKYQSEEEKIASYVDLDTLFKDSDVICLHSPLFPSTKGIINKNSISKMKDGVIIINNSRGALIVEEDLADALNSGKVYAAGLDVATSEPINIDNPLLKCPNCFITPHISWATKGCRIRIMDTAFDNLRNFIEGKPINVVN